MKQELLSHFLSKPIPVEERIAAGKDLRKNIPRIRQGDYKVSPDRSDPVTIFEAPMIRIAFAYADQNDKDYNALVKAAKIGRIKVAKAAS